MSNQSNKKDATSKYEQTQDDYQHSRICAPNERGSIGAQVWLDKNGSGRKGNDEVGIEGVTVLLYAADGRKIADQVTGKDGTYRFDNLAAGNYRVGVDQATLPADSNIPTFDLDGGKDSQAGVQLAPGEIDDRANFGYRPALGSIGDQIWLQKKGRNGERVGMSGVAVTLTQIDGDISRTLQTDRKGQFHFRNLPAGHYAIAADPDTLPDNVWQTFDRDGEFDHQTSVYLGAGQEIGCADFGYQERRPWGLLVPMFLGWLSFLGLLIIVISGFPPRADLVIEAQVVTLNQQYGCDEVVASQPTVEITVHNAGRLNATAFEISLNGEKISVDGLAAGGYQTFTFDVAQTAGELIAIADVNGDVSEADESNNQDMVVLNLNTEVSDPFKCQPDQADLAIVVTQQCAANGDTTLWAHVGNYGLVDVAGTVLQLNETAIEIEPLAAGEQVDLRGLPWDDAATVRAMIDPNNRIDEHNEDNNVYELIVDASSCQPPIVDRKAELMIAIVANCVDTTTAGGNVILVNAGNASAENIELEINGVMQTIGQMPAATTEAISFTVSSNDISATIDPNNRIEELDEANNTAQAAVDFSKCEIQRDLTVTISAEPICYEEDTTKVEVIVTNKGTLGVSEIDLLIGDELESIDSIAAGASSIITISRKVTGKQIRAVVDAENKIAESNNDNNEDAHTVEYKVCSPPPPLADLSVVVVLVETAQVSCGETPTAVAKITVTNSSSVPVSDFDVKIGSTIEPVARLDGNGSKVFYRNLWSEVQEVVADTNNAIAESNENNNRAIVPAIPTLLVQPCTVTPPPPSPQADLTVDLSVVRTSPQCDEAATVTATLTVTNVGFAAADQFAIAFNNEMIAVSGLERGKSHTVKRVVTAGQLTAVVDPNDEIDESNEFNNEATATVTVNPIKPCPPKPDLTIALACDYDAQTQSYIVVVEARNNGVGAVAPFSIDLNGRRFYVDGLAKSAMMRQSEHFPAGTGNFIARVDADNWIAESDESNNLSVIYVDAISAENRCHQVYDGCTRIDFEMGREAITGVRQAGTFIVREVADNRFVTSWRARVGEVDSGVQRNFKLSRDAVHVTVDFIPDDGGELIQMEIINHAPNTPHGWLARDICHALEVQYPTNS